VHAFLLVLLGIALFAGIAAWFLRSIVLALAVVAALALVPLQFTRTHQQADATIAVGTDPSGSATHVLASDVDDAYAARVAEAAVRTPGRRLAVRAESDSSTTARNEVTAAIDRVRRAVRARVPSQDEADARLAASNSAASTAQTQFDAAQADLAAWRQVRGDDDPTALRKKAERNLQKLERQRASADSAQLPAIDARIAEAQQEFYDFQSAEAQLGELTSAVTSTKQELSDAKRAERTARAELAAARTDDPLVAPTAIEIQKVDDSNGKSGFALAVAFFGCALVFAAWTVMRRRRASDEFAVATADAPAPTLATVAAPDAPVQPRAVEPEPARVAPSKPSAPPAMVPPRATPAPSRQPAARAEDVSAARDPSSERVETPPVPERGAPTEPIVVPRHTAKRPARSDRERIDETPAAAPEAPARPKEATGRLRPRRIIRSDVPDLTPMVFEPDSWVLESAPGASPADPSAAPKPAADARPSTSPPPAKPKPAPQPAVSVMLYRAAGTKNGDKLAPTFEMRAVDSSPGASPSDASAAPREDSRPREEPSVDLTAADAGTDAPSAPADPSVIDLTRPHDPEPHDPEPHDPEPHEREPHEREPGPPRPPAPKSAPMAAAPVILHRTSSGAHTRRTPVRPRGSEGQ
jgi:hypothetical protein